MKSKSININWLEYKGSIKRIPKKNNYKILHKKYISLVEYKKIYGEVGRKYNWLGRLNIEDNELRKIIHNSKVEIHLMQKKQKNIGFFELDYRNDYLKEKEVRIVHFGLIDEYIAKGFGLELMNNAITRIYELGIDKIICFGDSDNDLSLFLESDEAYAPENAKQAIKDIATAVISHHQEDGVARFLRSRFELL